jgi:cytoskeletal protein CcmA (bactofilin family)
VELLAPARLIGNVTAPRLIITEGVVFDGDCSMGIGKQKSAINGLQNVNVDRVAAAPSVKLQADSKT